MHVSYQQVVFLLSKVLILPPPRVDPPVPQGARANSLAGAERCPTPINSLDHALSQTSFLTTLSTVKEYLLTCRPTLNGGSPSQCASRRVMSDFVGRSRQPASRVSHSLAPWDTTSFISPLISHSLHLHNGRPWRGRREERGSKQTTLCQTKSHSRSRN